MGVRATTKLEHGNAAAIRCEQHDDLAVVRFTADPCGGPEALWFCLRVEVEAPKPATLELVLEHAVNLLGVKDVTRLRPVVRTDAEGWRRLPAGRPRTLPDGRVEAVWQVEAPPDWLELALCYPYGRGELEQLSRASGWACDEIGVSQGGRPIQRLSSGPGEVQSDRPGLYLIARQHSGETPGSWVLDGLVREIARGSLEQQPLVWAVPLANIDGIEEGTYGKDNYPYDLNRAWGRPTFRHETLVIQHDMARWARRCRPTLALDFHAPGGGDTRGVFAFTLDPQRMPEAAAAAAPWVAALRKHLAELAAEEFARVARYPSRWLTPWFSQFAAGRFDIAAMSIETQYAAVGEQLLTRERYREVGARVARAIREVGANP